MRLHYDMGRPTVSNPFGQRNKQGDKGTILLSPGDNEWKDLLTEYNGQTITYDEIGNPLSYRGYIIRRIQADGSVIDTIFTIAR